MYSIKTFKKQFKLLLMCLGLNFQTQGFQRIPEFLVTLLL